MRRVGVLESRAPDDPDGQARLAIFAQGLQELGGGFGVNDWRPRLRLIASTNTTYFPESTTGRTGSTRPCRRPK
jgi:hypothetical protein